MDMLLNILLLVIGFVFLVKGADIFVDGSAGLAKIFKISPLIIGLTIVACGTSAPELAVSTLSAMRGSSEIAISNIIGSNLFNLLAILGLCSLIHPLKVSNNIIKRDFPVSIIGSIIVTIVAFFLHVTNRVFGVILILAYILYVSFMIWQERKNPSSMEEDAKDMSTPKCIALILVGLALIIGGGEMVVSTAQKIAAGLGVSETLIGFTIVAIGTSLPELATSLMATKKKQVDLAVGNVIGSNIFNLFLILGVSSVIQPVSVNQATLADLIILSVTSILVLLFCIPKQRINRLCGGIMVALYVAVVIFAIYR